MKRTVLMAMIAVGLAFVAAVADIIGAPSPDISVDVQGFGAAFAQAWIAALITLDEISTYVEPGTSTYEEPHMSTWIEP